MKNYKSMPSIELIASFIDVTNAIHALDSDYIYEVIDEMPNDEVDIPTEWRASLVADKRNIRNEWNRRSHEASIGKDGEYGLESIEVMAFMYESMKWQSEDDMSGILSRILRNTFYNNIHDADKWIVTE